uniref:butyrophilin-like protein 2 n=1 Tax=Pristiophorus japonicus TaxID=55135 RepID=UPI00398F6BBF
MLFNHGEWWKTWEIKIQVVDRIIEASTTNRIMRLLPIFYLYALYLLPQLKSKNVEKLIDMTMIRYKSVVGVQEGHQFTALCNVSKVTSESGTFDIEWERTTDGYTLERVLHHSFSPNEEVVQYLTERVKARVRNSYLNATVSILNINPAILEDSGKYFCSVNGVKSLAITLFVCIPFKDIFIDYEPKEVVEGTEVSINCAAKKGYPEPYVQWIAGGNDISQKAVTIVEKLSNDTFDVKSSLVVSVKRGVKYACSIWNKYIENLLVDWVLPLPSATVYTPYKDIIGMVGNNVELICDVSIPENDPVTIAELGFYWVNKDPNSKEHLVYSFINEEENLVDQDPRYVNRAFLYWEDFLHGSPDLKIQNVSIEDMGEYICRVKNKETLIGEDLLELRVAAPYSDPVITYGKHNTNNFRNVFLICQTEGGFPLGNIRWLASNGKDLTSRSTTVIKVVNGSFKFRSGLHVSVAEGTRFSCDISNPWLSDKPSSTITFIS